MEEVLKILNIDFEELHDWNCCGASSGHALSSFLANALPLRNLVLAQRQQGDILAPCAACYNRLKVTDYVMRSDPKKKEELNKAMLKAMGEVYWGAVQIYHPLEVFSRKEVLERIEAKVLSPLKGLKVASYYGCLLTRPPKEVAFEKNPEQPQSMETILRAIGAEPISWPMRLRCCGASLAISETELVVKLSNIIVDAAVKAGADLIVTACPLCHSNLDSRQKGQNMPVLLISEIIGIALGADPRPWFRKHIVNPETLPARKEGREKVGSR